VSRVPDPNARERRHFRTLEYLSCGRWLRPQLSFLCEWPKILLCTRQTPDLVALMIDHSIVGAVVAGNVRGGVSAFRRCTMRKLWSVLALLVVVVGIAMVALPATAKVEPGTDLQIFSNGHDGVTQSWVPCWKTCTHCLCVESSRNNCSRYEACAI